MIVHAGELLMGSGSVWLFEGVAEVGDDDGMLVTFGVDHRIAQDLAALIEEEGEVACWVEEWQILSRSVVTA